MQLIVAGMMRHIFLKAGLVTLPLGLRNSHLANRVIPSDSNLRGTQGVSPISDSTAAAAARRGVKASSVRDMTARFTGRDTSLNTPMGDEADGDEWVDRLVGGGEHAEATLAAKQQDTLRRLSERGRECNGHGDRLHTSGSIPHLA